MRQNSRVLWIRHWNLWKQELWERRKLLNMTLVKNFWVRWLEDINSGMWMPKKKISGACLLTNRRKIRVDAWTAEGQRPDVRSLQCGDVLIWWDLKERSKLLEEGQRWKRGFSSMSKQMHSIDWTIKKESRLLSALSTQHVYLGVLNPQSTCQELAAS